MTFNEFADELLKFAVISSFGASRIDIMFDVYLHNSIKNVERENRETGKLQFQQVIGTQTIKQWGGFRSCDNNKAVFIKFLAAQ